MHCIHGVRIAPQSDSDIPGDYLGDPDDYVATLETSRGSCVPLDLNEEIGALAKKDSSVDKWEKIRSSSFCGSALRLCSGLAVLASIGRRPRDGSMPR